MNGCERFVGVLQGKPVDFLPRTPILMQFAAEHIGSNYGQFASDFRVLVRGRLILPREKRLVEVIKRTGAYVKLHICGNTTHLLPGMASLGLDIVDVDHTVSLAKVRETLGPRVAITGNLDPVAAVRNSTPGRIREAVRRAYESAGNPYMVNAGCEIPPGTPPQNLLALCEPLPFQR